MNWSIELEGMLRNHSEFLKRLIKDTGVFESAYTNDPNLTAYKLGVQSVGQELCQKMAEHHPRLFAELITEVNDERNN